MGGRGLWPFATIFFLATTLIFAYLALYYRAKEDQPAPPSAAVYEAQDEATQPVQEEPVEPAPVNPPPQRTPSAWETESKAAPMANVPVYDLGLPGEGEALEIELKTTVQWILLLYQTPLDKEIQRPELLLRGPGDKVYWGAGPLPTMTGGKVNSLAIPGDFLPQGGYQLILRGTDGERHIYLFRLSRKRLPWEEEEG